VGDKYCIAVRLFQFGSELAGWWFAMGLLEAVLESLYLAGVREVAEKGPEMGVSGGFSEAGAKARPFIISRLSARLK
jgi:hypothetical protein